MSTAETFLHLSRAGPANLPVLTERLVLRRPAMEDAARIAELLNNFNVAGNLSRVPFPFRLADTEAWLPRVAGATDPHESALLITTETDGVMGTVGFHREGGGTVLGYWLGEPYWGQGIMTEAVTASVKWFFALTGAPAVRSGVFHFNMASLAIQHKLGFVETGRSEVHCLARGKHIEHIDTELSRDDFENLGL